MTRVLAGDLGGTHLRLAIMDDAEGTWRLNNEHNTPSHDYSALLPAVQQYLSGIPRPDRICVAVPGPVEHGKATLPNLSWTVDAAELARATGINRTTIINDFVAIGHAIPHLGPHDVATVQSGNAEDGEPIVVVGPGTGLGQVFLLSERGVYRPHASEGGHADFAPSNPLEYELCAHLSKTYGHASVERVVSGPGLVATYRFLIARAGVSQHPEIASAPAGNEAAVISRLAIGKRDTTCVDALAIFVRTLARQAASFALTVEALGGVYVAGGIAPQILPAILDGSFVDHFREKGRMGELLASIPVHVVVAEHVGLLGAAAASSGG